MASSQWRNNYYNKKMKEYVDILGGKCVICGTDENLEFDHINPKEKSFVISSRYDACFEKIKTELDKCQLLCKSCHLNKSRMNGDVVGEAYHGSLGMYSHHKCRCDLCKKAWNKHMNEYKKRRKIK